MGNKPIVHAPIATGSTEPRDIRDRFADWCNVKDFGAKGDGLTDDSSAFLAAQASGAPAIMVPEGSYYITEDIPGIFYSFGEVEKTGIGDVTIINLLANGSVPVGTVIWLSTATVPAGFLLCNGQAVARDTYPDLFGAIGTTYGAGDGSTTFNLPNLIDKFIEGTNSNIGDSVAAGLPNITGYISNTNLTIARTVNGCFSSSSTSSTKTPSTSGASSDTLYKQINFNASNSNSIYGNSNTVQPPAVKLLPCIKAYSDVDNLGSLDVAQLENYVQNNVVHLTGDETVNGKKTFTTSVVVQRDNPYIRLIETDVSHHSGTSQTGYQGIYFYDTQEIVAGKVILSLQDSGNADLILAATRNISSDTTADYEVELSCQSTRTFFMPRGTNGVIELGGGGNKWKQVYASSSSISTSDERKKTSISFIPDDVLDAWGTVNFVQFKFKDAIQEKGSDSRIHSGLIAQRIDDAFKAFNLDASRYGLFCYDSWEAEAEEHDAEGNLMKSAREAGDEYSLRYEEALCMEAAYQRRRADRAEARIASLEERLAALEAKLEQ